MKKNIKKKQERKKIPSKNYLIVFFIILGIILISLYGYNWYKVKQKEKYMQSYLVKTDTISLTIESLEELNQVLNEMPSEYFMFISFTEDQEEYKLEKGLKTIIEKYDLQDKFYYFDTTKLKNNDLKKQINEAFKTDKINSLPAIIYKRNAELNVLVTDDNGMLKSADFEQLLETYQYKEA